MKYKTIVDFLSIQVFEVVKFDFVKFDIVIFNFPPLKIFQNHRSSNSAVRKLQSFTST